jgi:hypothetical protein
MSDKVDHSPVVLGGGSYDMNELQKVTDKAAKAGSVEARQKILDDELSKAVTDERTEFDSAGMPGYVKQQVKREIAPEVFVTENVTVFSPKEAAKVEKEAAADAAGGNKAAGGSVPAASEGSK